MVSVISMISVVSYVLSTVHQKGPLAAHLSRTFGIHAPYHTRIPKSKCRVG